METFVLILIGVLCFSGFIFFAIVDAVNVTQETKSHNTKSEKANKKMLWEELRDNFGFSYGVVLDSCTKSEFEEDFCEFCRSKNVVFSNFEERDKEYEKYRWSRIEGDKAVRINEWEKILPYFNKLHDREVTPSDFDKSFISLLKSPSFLINVDSFLETAYLKADWTLPKNSFV